MLHNTRALALSILVTVTAAATAAPHPPSHHDAAHDHDATQHHRTIEALKQRCQLEPQNTIALSKLARAQLAHARGTGDHHDLEEAESSFQALATLLPNSASAHQGIAYSRLGLHQFEDALHAARIVADLEPNATTSWALLGDIHFALGNIAEAEVLFDRCVEAEISMQSLARQALAHEYRNRQSQAEKTYREAILVGETLQNDERDIAWCHLILGEFLMNQGRHDDARTQLSRALELDSTSVNARWRLGQMDLVEGNAGRARETLQWLVHDQPRPTFMISLAQACALAGDHDAATHWLDAAEALLVHELEHGELGHVRELIELWVHRGTNLQRAAELAMHDLQHVRQDARTLETAAWAMHAAGESDQARVLIEQSLRKSATAVRSLVRAAEIFDALGDTRSAALLRDAAINRNPNAKTLASIISP